MFKHVISKVAHSLPTQEVSAHCDGPCGVYDPASSRIAAEAVLSMTKKLLDMGTPTDVASNNTFGRYVAIKEEQAQIAKDELLILWTDYFKPVHLEKYPDLHEKFWNAAKLCSAVKVEVSLEKAQALMAAIEEIHKMFWATKGRDVTYYTAS
ncbi:MAG: superoxide dismutase, Ni [Caldilineaceae bacterium]|nr:superoxide dismutase, Ni [Caldilineaceae bacterium]